MTQTGQLLRDIDIICRTINSLYKHINCGGCGAFASILSIELDKLKIKHEVWILDTNSPKEHADKIKKKLISFRRNNSHLNREDLHNNDIYIDHVVIKTQGVYFDSTGLTKEPNNCGRTAYPILQLTNAELHEMSSVQHGWNDTFDRQQIPSMSKKMVKLFNKMKGIEEESYLDKLVKMLV